MKKTFRTALFLFAVGVCLLFLTACGHEHAFDAWSVLVEPTCTTDGIEHRVCECGLEETRVLSTTGHLFQDATCSEPRICVRCGVSEGEALGHLDDNGQCIRCGISMGIWERRYYVDEFGDDTKDWYVSTKDFVVGSFSNSATTDSKLNVIFLIDKDDVAIKLLEYGNNVVKNSSSKNTDEYSIIMKTSDNVKTNIKGSMYPGSDRIFIDTKYESKVLAALKGEKNVSSVSFYIVDDDRTTTTYLFTVECSNFASAFSQQK